VEILWWLAPPVVATVLAMLWVSWLGREGRGAVDPEVAVRRLSKAMSRPTRVTARATSMRGHGVGERSTGIAVRPSRRPSGRASGRPSDDAASTRPTPTRRAS
jgi:hypothetical protein